ncbi:hypothetical protein PG996_008468 [Apiospora saccharicola]|uniref:Uncharacterized protein n=1 Tax=Apiospora saccharicola TaxID=335842 RepID=A0ABR1V0I8_9PEZI
MTAPTTPSPAQGPATQVDDAQLPSGQCRYILLNPEIKGHRCACVGFTLNRTLPSVMCECGHLSCYHIKEAEHPVDKTLVEQLSHRIRVLEEQLDRETQGGLGRTLGDTLKRLGQLEEQFEKSKDDIAHESRGLYRQISRVWQTVDQLTNREAALNDRLADHDGQLLDHGVEIQRIGGRLMETDDAAIELEERIDRLEASDDNEDDRYYSNPNRAAQAQGPTSTRPVEAEQLNASLEPLGISIASATLDFRHNRQAPEQTLAAPWTVHISLLPTASQPFPFEKDTTAYKRCLSRGLHQMIAVPGTDSDSFVTTVSRAFGDLLKGRTWVPLQARLCDAESLQGLPMLRPLDASLVGEKYDIDFLRAHCAVCGPNGRLDSLYIAMASDTISWHFLRRQPCYLEGLEDSWAYDEYLDPDDRFEDREEKGRPSAGDILPTLPTLKRAASEMSRTPSFSSGSGVMESEGSRPKVARTTCIAVPVEIRRRVETV